MHPTYEAEPAHAMSTGIPYLGSKISLISKSEIRYEGILYTIDTKESTVALAKVRSYGTEDRPTDRPVAPRDETYEYIIFRGADIKDIRVCQPPKPQPTLEGGLPNDPAIVQHSGGPPLGMFAPSGAPPTGAPRTQPFGSSQPRKSQSGGNYGPIGSGATPAAFSAAPGVAASNQQRRRRRRKSSTKSTGSQSEYRGRQYGSPVIDVTGGGRSGQSSPILAQSGGRPSSRASGGAQNGRGGNRGGRGGAFRGSQGRAGFRGNYRGGPPGGGFNRGGGRGGFQPGRPAASKKETLKFDKEYDFMQANEEFAEVLSKLQKTSIEDDGDKVQDNGQHEIEDGELVDEGGEGARKTPSTDAHQSGASSADAEPAAVYYDKTKSFFDKISCEAVERSQGKVNKPDWKAEKKLNRETFGVAGNVGGGRNFRGGPGGFIRGRGGGYRGYNRGGGYGFNMGYGGFNRGGFGGPPLQGGYGYGGRGRGGNYFGGRGRGMSRGRGQYMADVRN